MVGLSIELTYRGSPSPTSFQFRYVQACIAHGDEDISSFYFSKSRRERCKLDPCIMTSLVWLVLASPLPIDVFVDLTYNVVCCTPCIEYLSCEAA